MRKIDGEYRPLAAGASAVSGLKLRLTDRGLYQPLKDITPPPW